MRLAALSLLSLTLAACVPSADGAGEEPDPSTDASSSDGSPDTGGPDTPEPDVGAAADAGGEPDEEDTGGGGGEDAPAGGDVCGRADVAVCDGFEGGALDARYREINFGPSAVSLDTTRAHTGTTSVKVQSTNFTQMLATPVPGPRFYARVYLTSDTPMNPGHNTYINAGEGDGDPNHGEWVRVGEHREQLELNRKSDDKELLSSGDYNSLEGATQLAADRWYCLEVLYDGPGSEVRVWVDDVEVAEFHATDWTADYETFKFGYERYHGPDKTLWYDDLVLATERIGCL
jgi:hypothetical protein